MVDSTGKMHLLVKQIIEMQPYIIQVTLMLSNNIFQADLQFRILQPLRQPRMTQLLITMTPWTKPYLAINSQLLTLKSQ